jgi:hypothetical protein
MKKLRITRVITTTEVIPYGEGYYDGMTLEEAIKDEQDAGPENGWGEYIFEDPNVSYTTTVEVIDEDD